MIEIFSTCPPSSGVARSRYLDYVADVARWSEQVGCTGILVYSDNSLVDPWMLSQLIIQHTTTLCPLVAVQPVYMHPYWVAKQVTSLAYLYNRRLFLNMVAGGFKNDLDALNDTTPHDKRYARLVEYTDVILRLLEAGAPVTVTGTFYKTVNLKLAPPLSRALMPGVFVSGSSDAGMDAARALHATAIKYPKPANEELPPPDATTKLGIRVGIVTREDGEHAWSAARSRFPEDRRGQLTRELATKVSDSVWHREISGLAGGSGEENPYWLVPFQNYKTMCPYLVGSYETVARELARYIAVGYRTFILDVPPDPEELEHVNVVFARAQQPVTA